MPTEHAQLSADHLSLGSSQHRVLLRALDLVPRAEPSAHGLAHGGDLVRRCSVDGFSSAASRKNLALSPSQLMNHLRSTSLGGGSGLLDGRAVLPSPTCRQALPRGCLESKGGELSRYLPSSPFSFQGLSLYLKHLLEHYKKVTIRTQELQVTFQLLESSGRRLLGVHAALFTC